MSRGASVICSVFSQQVPATSPHILHLMSNLRSQLTDVVDFASFRGAMFSDISQFEAIAGGGSITSVSSLYPILPTTSSAVPRKLKLRVDQQAERDCFEGASEFDCKFFSFGGCKYGQPGERECYWLHRNGNVSRLFDEGQRCERYDREMDRLVEKRDLQFRQRKNTTGEGVVATGAAASEVSPQKRDKCNQFERNGRCSFEARCKCSHYRE
jgi:hypothetical protein